MIITKKHLRILKYVYKHKSVTFLKLKKHKKNDNLLELIEQLVLNHYLLQIGGSYNNYGEPVPISESTCFELDDLGIAEVESHQWFDFKFVLLQIILPIVIAIITTLITIFLTRLL